MENIEVSDSGLICDRETCDWEDRTITFADLPNWINRPCPKCGDNLLTYEDFVRVDTLMKSVEFINSLPESDLKLLHELTPEQTAEAMKNSPMFKDAKGIDKINGDGSSKIFVFNTHKEVKVTEIRNVD